MNRLQEKYVKEIRPELIKKHSYKSTMECPKVVKIVVNMCCGEAAQDSKALDAAIADMRTITGQQPMVCRAKKSIAGFKIREGQAGFSLCIQQIERMGCRIFLPKDLKKKPGILRITDQRLQMGRRRHMTPPDQGSARKDDGVFGDPVSFRHRLHGSILQIFREKAAEIIDHRIDRDLQPASFGRIRSACEDPSGSGSCCGSDPAEGIFTDNAVSRRQTQNSGCPEINIRSRLERIAGLDPVMQPIIGASDDEDYRNKAVMKISTGGLLTKKGGIQVPVHEPRIGFSPARSNEVTDCLDCRLQAGTAMAAAESNPSRKSPARERCARSSRNL